MYLLDTNVISELRKLSVRRADPLVSAWAETVDQASLFLSVITILEIVRGYLAIEPADAAQSARLRHWFEVETLPHFSGHILTVDEQVARRCATLRIDGSRPAPDSLIAATALVHNLTVVTRNTRHFEATGVRLLNP